MDRNDTLKILSILRGAYPAAYRGMSKQEAESIVALWMDMFAENDVVSVATAVKKLIAEDTKGYQPSIGKVKSAVQEMTRPALPGKKDNSWMEQYIQQEIELGRVSRYAREHGVSWHEAKEILDG